MGESRTELVAWLNELLQLNYRKVEQAGTGAAYCQVMDSIFRDVHLTKVKFETKHEYEYVGNYKVLQHIFDKHKIDKAIDKLMKCKFQDNLEFVQWLKRYWDENYPGGEYDAVLRRKSGAAKAQAVRTGAIPPARKSGGGSGSTRTTSRAASTTSGRLSSGSASAATMDNHSSSMIIDLNKQLAELKVTVDGLEKERDFYFGKLRDIEILVQEQLDDLEAKGLAHNGEAPDAPVLKEIQAVLYSTEDGFEVPPEEDELAGGGGGGTIATAAGGHHQDYDDETF
ncbi:calponin homology domain-containing protein [Zychaea mexicana]|uniref:calponin domain-containing protein n=1 Tax=Zychaea mexicana TaxID=64656 RepID=UPI0022FEEDED|nr:calponin domain-containing protein [Zychaea mexicana]KAI9488303.1 calponin homology domain-containing protein [Zychaea mexicana]